MKKIECLISDEKSQEIDNICDKECYTRAELNRRALEAYLWNINHKWTHTKEELSSQNK
jgi:metal-responsive CopG/Arc/MetJ family transcriptional regulator